MMVRKPRRVWQGRCVGKDELCDNVVEVIGINNGVMCLAIVFYEAVRVAFAYAPQFGMEWKKIKYLRRSIERMDHSSHA